ncbi:MAG: GAF domain-containing protein [Spirochaetes bacterium]|nr:GAF domain-containing protein [Spirochaetota bacterium]
MNKEKRFALVKTVNSEDLQKVWVSGVKPDIPSDIHEKWQSILDLLARIMKVPTGLITHFTEENLEVFAASNSEGNPYKQDDRDSLGIGMFCETVAGSGEKVLVNDTHDTEYWKNNPHAGLGMRSYCGVPIFWSDGELFGTFCVLSDKPGSMDADYLSLLEHFRALIERDLVHILRTSEMEVQIVEGRMRLRELHHRIKNQFGILISYINLKSRDSQDRELRMILKEVQHRIMALSLIHESLYLADNSVVPPMDVYLQTLCDYIVSDLAHVKIEAVYSVESVVMNMDTQVQIALVISELLTNSLKHAFPTVDSPEFELIFSKKSENKFELSYRDNGCGYPADFDSTKAGSIGIMLVNALVSQLKGSARFFNDNGAVFVLCFPDSDKK